MRALVAFSPGSLPIPAAAITPFDAATLLSRFSLMRQPAYHALFAPSTPFDIYASHDFLDID